MSRSPRRNRTVLRPAERRAAPLRATLAALLLALAAVSPGLAQTPPVEPADRSAAGTVHPFYAQLLDRGIYESRRGNAEAAASQLRLAVFGLLDDPATLVRGLAHLALAQEASGEREMAAETLARLIRVEERFTVFAAAALEAADRSRVEALMMERVPETVLAASTTFGGLADERLSRRLASLPAKERRGALAEVVARSPGDPRWELALAELELEAGNRAEAARLADRVLAGNDADRHPRAHCVRGLSLAETASPATCAAALPSLELCPRRTADAAVAAALLGCQAELERWRDGAAFLASLPPTVRDSRPVSRLARRVEKQARRLAAAEAPAVAESGAAPPPTAATTPAAPVEDPLDEGSRQRLAEARRSLANATTASQLEQPLEWARQVADAHPASREAQHLTAEIAYRASAWEQAARYFRRGGEPSRPELRFYMAVALYESGEPGAAREVLERALPELPDNPFVDSYAQRIREDGE